MKGNGTSDGVGFAIRAKRESMGISQEELARRVGITQPSIAVMEKQNARTKHLFEFCKALECTADELMGMSPPTPSGSRPAKPKTKTLPIERLTIKGVVIEIDWNRREVNIK